MAITSGPALVPPCPAMCRRHAMAWLMSAVDKSRFQQGLQSLLPATRGGGRRTLRFSARDMKRHGPLVVLCLFGSLLGQHVWHLLMVKPKRVLQQRVEEEEALKLQRQAQDDALETLEDLVECYTALAEEEGRRSDVDLSSEDSDSSAVDICR